MFAFNMAFEPKDVLAIGCGPHQVAMQGWQGQIDDLFVELVLLVDAIATCAAYSEADAV